LATRLNNLADLYEIQGQYEQVKGLYERALAILEKHFGEAHPNTARTILHLAIWHQQQNEYDKAKTLHEKALDIFTHSFKAEHPYVRLASKSYNDLLSKMTEQSVS
jgi:tetratricopeptide (TPR) repeat protein